MVLYLFSGYVIIKCLEPVPTKGLTQDDIPNLIQKIHEQMSIAYKELSKEVYSDLPSNYQYSLEG